MASIDDVLAAATARVARVRLCLRGDLLDRRAKLEEDLHGFMIAGNDDAGHVVAGNIKTVEAEIREAETEFVLAALPRKRWTDLMAEHRPTDEQRDRGADFNADTFPTAAIAACCTEPTGMTPEKFDALEEVIGYPEWQELWAACLSVNVTRDRLGESVAASVVLERWRQNSEQPSTSASPEASSSDE